MVYKRPILRLSPSTGQQNLERLEKELLKLLIVRFA